MNKWLTDLYSIDCRNISTSRTPSTHSTAESENPNRATPKLSRMSSSRKCYPERTIDPTVRRTLNAFHTVLASRYSPHLKVVYLFGSRARQDHRPDSDADLAAFVDAERRACPDLLRDQLDLSGEANDIWLDTGIRIQLWVFAVEALRHLEQDDNIYLLTCILSEGIVA